jgi:hypothetical protein
MAMVIDYDKSEKGPQRRKTATGRLLHCCCICGKLDVWGGSWSTYCSESDIDDGVAIPKFCSAACKSQGGPHAANVTEAVKETSREAEKRSPETAYREQTPQEKYRSAVDAQQSRGALLQHRLNNQEKTMDFAELQGKTLTKVEQIGDDVIRFEAADGKAYQLYHSQDCCESVTIEDVCGDLADLVGTPILLAEESTSEMPPEGAEVYEDDLWTFYKLRTIKGSVDIRWHGSSNGYYSVSVDFGEAA